MSLGDARYKRTTIEVGVAHQIIAVVESLVYFAKDENNQMKLTILGSGTVVPNGQRNSAGYFVEAPGLRLMMDCGAGTLHALSRYNLPWERMTHVFVSHFHVDHVGELASLFAAFRNGMSVNREEPLTLIGPQGLQQVVDGLQAAFGPNLLQLG